MTITGGNIQAISTGTGRGIGGGSKLSSDASTVTLGYTNATRDLISITASSYSGTVTLDALFTNSSGNYAAGTVAPGVFAKLAAGALKPWDGTTRTWAELQSTINGAENGSTIRLTQDYTALPDDSALTLTLKTITIDLNGFTLDRGLKNGVGGTGHSGGSGKENGFVIDVGAGSMLTLKDSRGGGQITGGNTAGNAGGIRNEGILIIENARIAGNKATGSGGGILNSGSLTVRGGEITDNTAGTGTGVHGGGIYNSGILNLQGGSVHGNSAGGQGGGILNNGDMNISGAPVVVSNSASAGNNIYLRGAHPTMTVTGGLTAGADLYVTKAGNDAGFVTGGYSAYNTVHPDAFFHADEPAFDVALVNGEAYIGTAVKGTSYLSYAWRNGQLDETANTTDSRWLAWLDGTDIPGGQYVVNRNVTVNDRILLEGDTSIILCDGCELNVKGLYIPSGCTLTIYGQSGGTGTLVSNPSGGAGIGGYSGHDNGSIVIHGGTIRATGYSNCAGIGSNDGQKTGSITIYGGTVTATGGSYGAGIGGGRDSDADLIRIYGGIVTATGKNSSAGIGGGDPQDSSAFTEYIEIYGGTVTAAGDDKGAGIGGGEYSSAIVKIYGGKVTATGGDQGGAGIGSGKDGGGSHIDITGGEVEARTASSAAVGMGNCDSSKGSSIMTFGYTDATGDGIRITSPSYGGSVTVNQTFIDSSLSAAFVPGTYADPAAMAGRTLVKYATAPAVYRTLAGTDGTADCYPVAAAIRSWDAAWYALTQNVAFDGEIAVTGNVNLILGDGFTLTAQNIKVPAGSSLTIWSQTNGTGKLITAATGGNAGIGGADCDCGAVTINGGVIQASGGSDGGAGIGGAREKKGGRVTINRGTVSASSGESGAGIGGGYKGTGSGTIVITGGSVTATGNGSSPTKTGAGIGGGYDCPSVAVTITGGTVTAITNGQSAAIGAGACSFSTDHEGGTVTISGGNVTARNLDDDDLTSVGTAIGGAWKGGLVVVDIYGGQVTATGGFMSIGSARRGKTCYTYLSYTDESKDTMSVTADRYGRTSDSTGHSVTLVKGFRAEGDDSLQFAAGGYGLHVTMLDGLTLVPDPPVEYTVTFDPDNGEDVKTRTVISGETAVPPADPVREGYLFLGWYLVTDGSAADTAFDFENTPITGDITLKALWAEIPAFGTPDFVIPAGVTAIEDNAFEGIAASAVEVPAGCASIGGGAFKDCLSLTRIRIPAGCALGADVFEGCGRVFIFSAVGSEAEAYCQSHANCVFVEEGQN